MRRDVGGATRARRSLLGMLACSVCASAHAAEADEKGVAAPPVEVVAPTPLPGLGIARDKVPANVQSGDAQDLRNPGR